jgi:hypothetical protein
MILVLGSSADRVYPTLISTLEASGHPFIVVDEDQPGLYKVACEESNGQLLFRITGGECTGDNTVGSIFVRHAVGRTLDPQHLAALGILQSSLNYLLLFASCPIINPPTNAYSNYSKSYQVGLLAEHGFKTPTSLVTNIPEEAHRFCEECGNQVIFKGVSNVTTLAQVLKPEHFERFQFLPNSPTLFQEFVAGVDYRVHVVGDEVFVTRLISRNEDYRRSLLVTNEDVQVEPAELPLTVREKCIAITKHLGLTVSGIDFKETPDGDLVVLELNPYPQFTFYESRSGQPISKAVVDYMIRNQATHSNVYS